MSQEDKLLHLIQAALQAELQPIKDQLRALEQGQKSLEEGQKSLAEGQSRLEEGQKKLTEQLGGAVEQLLEKIDEQSTEVKSEIRHLSTVQERQQGVIELLSYKSVEHESVLKRKN